MTYTFKGGRDALNAGTYEEALAFLYRAAFQELNAHVSCINLLNVRLPFVWIDDCQNPCLFLAYTSARMRETGIEIKTIPFI